MTKTSDRKGAEPGAAALPPPPLLELRDVKLAAVMPFVALASWLLPEGSWLPLCRALASLQDRLGSGCAAQAEHIRAVAGDPALAARAKEVAVSRLAFRHLERLQLLRCHRPGGWNPTVRLEGRERIEAALAEGRGVILWPTLTLFAHIVTKMALSRAGIRIVHLRRYLHGFSESLWGARLLNPIRTRAERSYIGEPLIMGPDDLIQGQRTLPLLAERLRSNLPVWIAVGGIAHRLYPLPVLGGRFPLATGPIWLAFQTGAPVLPVFTLREPDGSFTVTVERRIDDPGAEDREAALEAALRRYAALLETVLARAPEQFDWTRLEPRRRPDESRAPAASKPGRTGPDIG